MKNNLKFILFFASGCIATILSIVFFPIIREITSKWSSNEALVFVTALGVLAAAIVPLVLNISRTHLLNVDLDIVPLENGYVIFKFFIENGGNVKLELYKSNLYIDEGKEGNSNKSVVGYKFPPILNYTVGADAKCDDCNLAKECRKGNLSYPQTHSDNTPYCGSFEIEHFSDQSIRHLSPKERHSEDFVLLFNKEGIFRATFIVVDKTNVCSCSSKQFVVKKKRPTTP
jgi:hypothetical protein